MPWMHNAFVRKSNFSSNCDLWFYVLSHKVMQIVRQQHSMLLISKYFLCVCVCAQKQMLCFYTTGCYVMCERLQSGTEDMNIHTEADYSQIKHHFTLTEGWLSSFFCTKCYRTRVKHARHTQHNFFKSQNNEIKRKENIYVNSRIFSWEIEAEILQMSEF